MTASPKAYRGTEAARAASSAVPAAGDFVITDQGNIYIGDGTTAAAQLVGAALDITPRMCADGVGVAGHDDTAAFVLAHDHVLAHGGRVRLDQKRYELAGAPLDTGVTYMVDTGGVPQVGAAAICQLVPHDTYEGFLVKSPLYQTVTPSSIAVGTYTLTGGWGGSVTSAAISPGEALSSIQTKLRALTRFGAVTVTADPAGGFAYRVNMDDSIGDPSSALVFNGTLTPPKLTVNTTGLSAGTVTVKQHVVESAGMTGVEFVGGVLGADYPAVGGVWARSANKLHLKGISGTQCSRGVIVGGGDAWVIEDPTIQNFMFAAAPQKLGALTVFGNDHWVRGGEYAGTGGPAGGTMVDPAGLTSCAFAWYAGTSKVDGIVTEFGDIDLYVAGGENVFSNWRVDMAAGHGVYEEPGFPLLNQFVNGQILSCGLYADNTYDGMNLNGIGHRVAGVSFFKAVNTSSANRMRYGVFDGDTSGTVTDTRVVREFPSTFSGLGGDINTIGTDWFFSVLGRGCDFGTHSGVPTTRPKSRFLTGTTWDDGTRLTHARGGAWRDSSGEIVGNILGERLSTLNAGSDWQAYLGLGVLTRVDGHADFNTFRCLSLVANSAAVTAGYVAAVTLPSIMPVVDAERLYVAGVRGKVMSARANPKVAAQITWRDASHANISATAVTSWVAIGTTNTFAAMPITTAAPSNAVEAIVVLFATCDSLTSGDEFRLAVPTVKAGTTMTDVELP